MCSENALGFGLKRKISRCDIKKVSEKNVYLEKELLVELKRVLLKNNSKLNWNNIFLEIKFSSNFLNIDFIFVFQIGMNE